MIDFVRENKIRAIVSNNTRRELHFHQDIELIYVLEGILTLSVYEKTFFLGPEDIIVINSNHQHQYTGSEDVLMAQVKIPYNMVRQCYSGPNATFLCNSTVSQPPALQDMRKVLRSMLLEQMVFEQQPESENQVDYAFLSSYFKLLKILTESFLFQSFSGSGVSRESAEKRMVLIEDYVQQNFDQPITLKTLSTHLYLSEGYLSRFFKKHFQVSFTVYLKSVRLYHAMNQLLYSNKPITKIAYDTGFSSVSFFNRVFKQEYKQTPSAFRDSAFRDSAPRAEGEKTQKSDKNALQKRLVDFLNAEDFEAKTLGQGGKAHYAYSVQQTTPLCPVWCQILNAGSTTDLLRREVQAHIMRLSESLHFRYARFWNLFSAEMHVAASNSGEKYNFRRIDQVIDFILDAGLIPFIDLEEKVRRINDSVSSMQLYEPQDNVFPTLSSWENLIRSLLEHWLRRYGQEKMSQWKIEIWYNGYQIDDEDPLKNFLMVFRSTYQIVKRLVPQMEVGGSGFFPQFVYRPKERKINFWKEWVYQAPKPDFVSIVNFAYLGQEDGADHYGSKSVDEKYLLHSIERLKEEVDAIGWQGMKFFVTEWNRTVSDRNILNDTPFQGAYIIKNMMDVYDRVGMVGYYAGSDCLSESYDTGHLLHGGQGLLSLDGILKPSAFAIYFLNELYPFVIGKNEHCLITTDQNGNFAIIAHNTKQLSSYYYLTDEDKLDRNNLWKCFEELAALEMEIQLSDVANGDYYVKVQYVNSQHGSIFDIWQELDFQQDLDAEILQYFREACKPHMMIRKYTVTDQNLLVPVLMQANEFAIIRIDFNG